MFQGLGSTSGSTEQNIKHLSWACWCMQSSKIIPSCTVSSRLAWQTREPVRKGKKKKRTGDWSCSVRQWAICTISTKSIDSSFGPPLSSGHSPAQQQLATKAILWSLPLAWVETGSRTLQAQCRSTGLSISLRTVHYLPAHTTQAHCPVSFTSPLNDILLLRQCNLMLHC